MTAPEDRQTRHFPCRFARPSEDYHTVSLMRGAHEQGDRRTRPQTPHRGVSHVPDGLGSTERHERQ
jgi:hypothetical protein